MGLASCHQIRMALPVTELYALFLERRPEEKERIEQARLLEAKVRGINSPPSAHVPGRFQLWARFLFFTGMSPASYTTACRLQRGTSCRTSLLEQLVVTFPLRNWPLADTTPKLRLCAHTKANGYLTPADAAATRGGAGETRSLTGVADATARLRNELEVVIVGCRGLPPRGQGNAAPAAYAHYQVIEANSRAPR